MESRARNGAELDAHAVPVSTSSQAKPVNEPLSDWQVFTVLGGTAGGFLGLGIAALYGLSFLVN
jgi:hypothetical protein